MSRTDLERLNQLPAQTGRKISEDGSVVNTSISHMSGSINDPSIMASLGKRFIASKLIPGADSSADSIIGLTATTKYVIVHSIKLIQTGSHRATVYTYFGEPGASSDSSTITSSFIPSDSNPNFSAYSPVTGFESGFSYATNFFAQTVPSMASNFTATAPQGCVYESNKPFFLDKDSGLILDIFPAEDDPDPSPAVTLSVEIEFSELTDDEFNALTGQSSVIV